GGPGGLLLLFQSKKVFNPGGSLGRNNPIVAVPLPSQSPTIGMSPVWPIDSMVMSPVPRLFVLRRKNVFVPATGLSGPNTPMVTRPSPPQSPATATSPLFPKPAIVFAGGTSWFLFSRKYVLLGGGASGRNRPIVSGSAARTAGTKLGSEILDTKLSVKTTTAAKRDRGGAVTAGTPRGPSGPRRPSWPCRHPSPPRSARPPESRSRA